MYNYNRKTDLYQQLAYLRWQRSQHEHEIRHCILQTRSLEERDNMIKSSENVASNIESKERIIYCVQDEFQQPLSLPRHVVQDVNMKDTIRTTLMRESSKRQLRSLRGLKESLSRRIRLADKRISPLVTHSFDGKLEQIQKIEEDLYRKLEDKLVTLKCDVKIMDPLPRLSVLWRERKRNRTRESRKQICQDSFEIDQTAEAQEIITVATESILVCDENNDNVVVQDSFPSPDQNNADDTVEREEIIANFIAEEDSEIYSTNKFDSIDASDDNNGTNDLRDEEQRNDEDNFDGQNDNNSEYSCNWSVYNDNVQGDKENKFADLLISPLQEEESFPFENVQNSSRLHLAFPIDAIVRINSEDTGGVSTYSYDKDFESDSRVDVPNVDSHAETEHLFDGTNEPGPSSLAEHQEIPQRDSDEKSEETDEYSDDSFDN